jgi:hypothetical protein
MPIEIPLLPALPKLDTNDQKTDSDDRGDFGQLVQHFHFRFLGENYGDTEQNPVLL